MVTDHHSSPDHPDDAGASPSGAPGETTSRSDALPIRDTDSGQTHHVDDADIRSILAGLRDPAVSRQNLADRLRLSLDRPQPSEHDRRPLPPIEPTSHSRISYRAMLPLIAGIAAAALLGAVTLSVIGLPDTPVEEVFAVDTLRRAGVTVTSSGTSYRTDSLAEQALPLLDATTQATSPERAQHFVALGATNALTGPPAQGDTSQMERDVLSCLRHLRIPSRDVVAVDLAHLDGRSAVVVVTADRAGRHQVRAIDPACPVLRSAVLAGPRALGHQP